MVNIIYVSTLKTTNKSIIVSYTKVQFNICLESSWQNAQGTTTIENIITVDATPTVIALIIDISTTLVIATQESFHFKNYCFSHLHK
ncbi:MAG: hypothetical protein IH598_00285 [Bacteroidales bacterium]|nr:hypothetical protein [Bacteroidales bacterium]